MDPKLLIDGIVRQTTVLIAQLSTAAGIRAPLAHVADEVFLTLANEIEAQGVGRKVAADMFGLALRTYQRKVQRLGDNIASRERSLWETVLEYVRARGRVFKGEVVAEFQREGEADVIAVLTDLVASGLLFSSGRGEAAIYCVTSDADRRAITEGENLESAASLVWASIYRRPGVTVADLALQWRSDVDRIRNAVDRLVAEGRVRRVDQRDDAALEAETLLVPVGAKQGWEGAVYDHFQAVASAIGTKVMRGMTRSEHDDRIGGATLSFDLGPDHPYAAEVYGLLARVRKDVNELWNRVYEYNRRHAVVEDNRTKVTFYFGQNVAQHDAPDA